MFTDIHKSADVMIAYKSHLEKSYSSAQASSGGASLPEISVHILT
jgi:hypothetical protein